MTERDSTAATKGNRTMPRVTRAKQPPLSPVELELLLRALNRRHPGLTIAFNLMGRLGLRAGEALAARESWIHDLTGENAVFVIPPEATKTGVGRTLPIPGALKLALLHRPFQDQLDALETKRSNPPLSRNRWGGPPTQQYMTRCLRNVATLVLKRSLRSHTLRHTFATRLLPHTNLRVVQLTLGHKSIKSTELYTHPTLTDIRNALDRLEVESISAYLGETNQ